MFTLADFAAAARAPVEPGYRSESVGGGSGATAFGASTTEDFIYTGMAAQAERASAADGIRS